MGIDIFSIQPHVVSRDLRGYSFLIYSPPKYGKTTFISKCPRHLLLATEPGYKALPGVMVQPITRWSELKQTVKQLKKPEAHELFEVIGIDTADLAYQYCTQYICANEGVDNI